MQFNFVKKEEIKKNEENEKVEEYKRRITISCGLFEKTFIYRNKNEAEVIEKYLLH